LLFCAVFSLAAQNFNVQSSLRSHVDYLCSEQLAGRKAGSQGEASAAKYIWNQMNKAGLTMLTDAKGQDFSIESPDGKIHSCNIVGLVEGYDKALRSEYVVVGAHFDGIGTNSVNINGQKTTQLYPGADDNASGTAALIELAKLVSDNRYLFARNILFVAFGASECGTAGSWYFINRAFPDSVGVKAMVNLDMLGRGNERNRFQVFSTLPMENLNFLLERTLEDPVVTPPVTFSGTVQTSDHLPFYQKNIPIFLFTTGKTPEYRSTADKPSLVLCRNMERECNYIFYFLKNLAMDRDHLSVKAKAAPKSNIYTGSTCDVRPQFFHSDELHFLKVWVYKYVKYPQECLDEGIQGKVLVSFTVTAKGKVKDVRVEQGVDPQLDAEAVRVISVSPDWTPGKVNGHPVDVRLTVPVEFKLTTTNKLRLKR